MTVGREGPLGRNGDNGEAPDFRILKRYREFRATSFAIEHRTSVVVLLAIITIMGVLSYKATPKEAFPELPIPITALINSSL